MTETMTGEAWLDIYRDSGEQPPAGVLYAQLRAMDARYSVLVAERDALRAALATIATANSQPMHRWLLSNDEEPSGDPIWQQVARVALAGETA